MNEFNDFHRILLGVTIFFVVWIGVSVICAWLDTSEVPGRKGSGHWDDYSQ